jgi:hypothetical protein
VTNYPNDPNQPGGYGEQPKDGSGDGSGNNPQYGSPQYGAPQSDPQYGAPQYGAPQYGEPQQGGNPQYGAQPYGSPQYGAPQQGGSPYGAQAPQEYSKATMILVFGILGFCCFIFGVVAIVMGRQGLQEIDRSNGVLTGRQKVKVGYILGIVFTVLNVIGIIYQLTAKK